MSALPPTPPTAGQLYAWGRLYEETMSNIEGTYMGAEAYSGSLYELTREAVPALLDEVERLSRIILDNWRQLNGNGDACCGFCCSAEGFPRIKHTADCIVRELEANGE